MKKHKKSKLFGGQRKGEYMAYVFLIPWFLGFVLLVAWPTVQTVWYSLCEVRVTASELEITYHGFENYVDVWMKNIYFIRRVLNFLLSCLIQTPVIVIFSLLIALMLNSIRKGKGVFRTIFFLPVIIVSGPVINELVGQGATSVPMLEEQWLMQAISTVLPAWAAEPISMLFSQLITILWYSGIQILLFLAMLQRIDLNMIEAARIDGASGWEIFWKMTLPAIRPIILLNTVYTIVNLANSDRNDVISLISSSILDPMQGYGIAAAMAWIHTVIVLLLLGLSFLLLRKKRD
ncbi:MAG: sugar ABC transporter permease [Oscillospiraceae bacterium]|nr:sugar ABC transporter permease [Oscillospiraceae bacterium]